MRIFKNIYSFLEQHFFNTLTRKLAGNCLLLLLVPSLAFFIILRQNDAIGHLLSTTTHLPGDTTGALQQIVGHTLQQVALLDGVGLIVFLCTLLFLRRLIVRPVRELSHIFQAGSGEESNLSLQLPLCTYDEFRDLSHHCNDFLEHLRTMFQGMRQMGLAIAVHSAQAAGKMNTSAEKAVEQGSLAGEIFAASQESASAFGEIANLTQGLCASTASNLTTARASFEELMTVSGHIHTMNERIASSGRTMEAINAASQDIRTIVSLIRSISTQTSLLSLNAAIEAARAGQAGKGFNVVAEEVKKLAEQVNRASEDIGEKISVMLGQIETSLAESEEVTRYSDLTREAVDRSCHSFQAMISDFEQNDGQLQGITASVEELTAANREIHSRVEGIRQSSVEVAGWMTEAQSLSQELKTTTENLQEQVAHYHIGRGVLEKMVERTRDFRDQAQARMEQMLGQGLDLFDQQYRQVPGSDPPKYRTSYDDPFTPVMQPLYDKLLEDIPDGVFALCVDSSGYAPTHNSRFANPVTGDYQTDLAASRDKRLFNDPTGLRAARNTRSFLLQTYMRDTGEVLSDLSMPIYLGGRHWGGVRIGFNPQTILEEQ